MKRNRKYWLTSTAILALLIAAEQEAEAVIPVTDGGAIAELFAQVGEAEKAFALQLEQYATQIKEYVGTEWSWLTQAGQYATQLKQYFTESLMAWNFIHHP